MSFKLTVSVHWCVHYHGVKHIYTLEFQQQQKQIRKATHNSHPHWQRINNLPDHSGAGAFMSLHDCQWKVFQNEAVSQSQRMYTPNRETIYCILLSKMHKIKKLDWLMSQRIYVKLKTRPLLRNNPWKTGNLKKGTKHKHCFQNCWK